MSYFFIGLNLLCLNVLHWCWQFPKNISFESQPPGPFWNLISIESTKWTAVNLLWHSRKITKCKVSAKVKWLAPQEMVCRTKKKETGLSFVVNIKLITGDVKTWGTMGHSGWTKVSIDNLAWPHSNVEDDRKHCH